MKKYAFCILILLSPTFILSIDCQSMSLGIGISGIGLIGTSIGASLCNSKKQPSSNINNSQQTNDDEFIVMERAKKEDLPHKNGKGKLICVFTTGTMGILCTITAISLALYHCGQ